MSSPRSVLTSYKVPLSVRLRSWGPRCLPAASEGGHRGASEGEQHNISIVSVSLFGHVIACSLHAASEDLALQGNEGVAPHRLQPQGAPSF